MATQGPQANQAWHHALKLRKHLLKQLDKVKASSAAGVDVSQFETVDDLLEKFRLACVHTIFLDFDYAVAENTEEALWLLHVSINSEYRRTLNRLKNSTHAVEKRKAEKLYINFLRIAQKFYKGYIQRLYARFDVPELKHVAQGIEVEQLTAEDRISPVSADLSRKVLQACHSTLLRLGDLARYRVQARHKNSGYETAVTHYSLAHHLMPNSGFAFHQLGIVDLEQGNHIDIVYHFYRAWAVQAPHPNAKQSLESEFKVLQQPPSAAKSKHASSTPQAPLIMWFVRLHALFYKGEVFQQQVEMEGEVMHRLEMAARNADSAASSADTLLKMALVNISAYDIASANNAEKQTPSSMRFSQYTLRFNARFILTICAALEFNLKKAIPTDAEDAENSGSTTLTPTIECCLPVLRVYSMWLAARHHDLFATGDAFGSVIPTMMQNLSKVFTLLCLKTYHNQADLATCPYLLAEDLEIRGLRPLGEDQVPMACRCYCLEDGTRKTYAPAPEERIGASGEYFARILDTLRCAYFLAEDDSVPLGYRVVDNCLVFECQPDRAQAPHPTQPAAIATNVANTYSNGLSTRRGDNGPTKSTSRENVTSSNSDNDLYRADGLSNGQSRKSSGKHEIPLPLGSDEGENTVISVLAPFLKPPTPQPQDGRGSTLESSYGMHTATANELLASFQTNPSPSTSISSGKFEPLPWTWFDTPRPYLGVEEPAFSAGRQAFTSGSLSPNQSPITSAPQGKMALEDPFATPGRHHPGTGLMQQPTTNSTAQFRPMPDSAHRENLLQSFAGAKARQTSSFSDWAQNQNAARQQLASTPAPGKSSWATTGADYGNLNPQPTSPFTSTTFSHPSSLYQGTPMNGATYGAFATSTDDWRSGQRSSLPQREYSSSAAMRLQIDDTTQNYDQAILRAALQSTGGASKSQSNAFAGSISPQAGATMRSSQPRNASGQNGAWPFGM